MDEYGNWKVLKQEIDDLGPRLQSALRDFPSIPCSLISLFELGCQPLQLPILPVRLRLGPQDLQQVCFPDELPSIAHFLAAWLASSLLPPGLREDQSSRQPRGPV